jgi:hypothetical protein
VAEAVYLLTPLADSSFQVSLDTFKSLCKKEENVILVVGLELSRVVARSAASKLSKELALRLSRPMA